MITTQDQREQLNSILINYNRNYISDASIEKIFESKYNRQAIEFLIKTKTKIDIDLVGKDSTPWDDKIQVNKYKVTLKNLKHEYSFKFHDSINNTEKKISSKYDFYSVLACLSYYVPDSFDDFCSEFGYEFKNESEYIKAKSTHLECLDQQKNLNKLFTSDEMSLLSEIN